MKRQAAKDVKSVPDDRARDKALADKAERLLKFKERPGYFRGARVRPRT